MLTHLSIANIVLIEKAELAFERGLCVLSGETGAGKSILLDALGLVLGGRADSALIRRDEAQGQVSAEFDISGHLALADLLAELEIEVSDTLIIRRSLTADGTKTYLWDVRNRLAQIKQGASTIATFEYDSVGRRAKKTVSGVTTQYRRDQCGAGAQSKQCGQCQCDRRAERRSVVF